ncbi:MAG: hypothetical protein NTZ19_06245 [Bacteroidetes bacterium]|nr:hypothetical protein [Bacteroidota bacterium]
MKSIFKQFSIFQIIILLGIPMLLLACKSNKGAANNENSITQNESLPTIPFAKEGVRFDSVEIVKFIKKYPAFKGFQKQFDTVYETNGYKTIWQDEDGLKELSNNLESINWFLPTKKFSYLELLQKNLADTSIKGIGTAVERIPQYAGLKKQLGIYNALSKNNSIPLQLLLKNESLFILVTSLLL